jgi:hypothetical protein
MKKPEYRYWKSVKTGNCVFAPKSRDLGKHGLWVEITEAEYRAWDESVEVTE